MPEYTHLIGTIYDAAINQSLWPEVTRQIAEYCGGERVMLATTDTLHPLSNFQHTHNIPLEQVQAWREGLDEEEVALHNRWAAQAGAGVPVSSDDYFGSPELFLQQGGPFVEMLNKIGIRRQLVMFFELNYFRISGVGLNNYHPFPDYAQQRMSRLAAHLSRSLEIYHQLLSLQAANRSLYQLLELLSSGVILLDAAHKVRYATHNARKMLIENDRLWVKQGKLCAREPGSQLELQGLVTNAVSVSQRALAANAGGVMGMAGSAGKDLILTVVPLSAMEPYRELYSDHIAAAIFVSLTGKAIELPLVALQRLYDLTPRELQLCQVFVNTPDIGQVAQEMNLKPSSVRSLLKSIYYKTGKTSQAELMRLLMEARLNFRHS